MKRLFPRALLAAILCRGWPVAAVAAVAPEAPALPRGWELAPVTKHPCLLFGAEETPVIKARLLREFGSLDRIRDGALAAYFSSDETVRRKSTTEFIAYWKNYAQRWSSENLKRDRPDGVSLRGIRRCIYLYDVVASFGYLGAADEREFRDALVRAVELALGPDHRHLRLTPDEGFRRMNIWTDVVTAAGTVGLAFPDLPQARSWIELAVVEINRQFGEVVWDGAWHESPRYQAAMLTITGLFFHALERRTGVDLFRYPQYRAMLDWFVRFQTPLDKTAGPVIGRPQGVALLPGIGDSSWTNESFGVLAMFAPHFARTEPHFAARLMWAWDRAGRPYDGDSVEWARVLIDSSLAPEPQVLGSDCSPGKGYVVMRSGFDMAEERWFLLRCGNATRSGHDNADWNGFNLYAFGVPLALDSASGSYSDPAHRSWHKVAMAHNTVVFGGRSQAWKDGRILSWVTRPEADYSVSDASVPAGVERFVRHVLFVKPDYFVIWDQVDSREPAAWMLHTPATDFEWSEHRVRGRTPWDVNFDVHVVWPATTLTPHTDKGRFGEWTEARPTGRDLPPFRFQDYFGIPNDPGRDFLVVLHPLKPGQPALGVRQVGGSAQPELEITCGVRIDWIRLGSVGADLRRGESAPVLLPAGQAP